MPIGARSVAPPVESAGANILDLYGSMKVIAWIILAEYIEEKLEYS
jgi:hypothetical protein